jgi:hypothetical protein
MTPVAIKTFPSTQKSNTLPTKAFPMPWKQKTWVTKVFPVHWIGFGG